MKKVLFFIGGGSCLFFRKKHKLEVVMLVEYEPRL